VLAQLQVQAPAPSVRAVLVDYAHIDRLNPDITESRLLPAPAPGVARVRTVIEACAMFFCRSLTRVEDVRPHGETGLRSDMVPAQSDFEAGTSYWLFEPEAGGTLLSYQATLEPKFWVPPVIGPALVTRSLRKELLILFENLETEAQRRGSAP
jgi:hypothetical protein